MEYNRKRLATALGDDLKAVGVMRAIGQKPVLVSADACVPYRTTLRVAERYDSASVAKAVDEDFRAHGAPLAWRADRASCHRTDEVDEVLRAWGVLRLHGPAHLARYTDSSNDNREHRGWLSHLVPVPLGDLLDTCERMRRALNEAWPRRTLAWMTAAEKCATRRVPTDDRVQLRALVDDRLARLRRDPRLGDDVDALLAQRLATEQTLTPIGYLRRQPRGWC